jgi:hypothetical protein
MNDQPRYCQLPGCDAILEPLAGNGTPRRYCSAEHRIEARRLRHRAASSPNPSTQASAHGMVVDATPAVLGRTARRPRVAATLGVAALLGGVLVGGAAILTRSQPDVQPDALPTGASPVNKPEGPTNRGGTAQGTQSARADWVRQANVTLTALNQQIQQIDQAEATWRSMPHWQHTAAAVAAINRLEALKAELIQQQAALQTNLAGVDEYQRTLDQAAAVQQQLDTLRSAQQASGATPTTAVGPLGQLQATLTNQLGMLHAEADSWSSSLAAAQATPLPDSNPHAINALLNTITGASRLPGPPDEWHGKSGITPPGLQARLLAAPLQPPVTTSAPPPPVPPAQAGGPPVGKGQPAGITQPVNFTLPSTPLRLIGQILPLSPVSAPAPSSPSGPAAPRSSSPTRTGSPSRSTPSSRGSSSSGRTSSTSTHSPTHSATPDTSKTDSSKKDSLGTSSSKSGTSNTSSSKTSTNTSSTSKKV